MGRHIVTSDPVGFTNVHDVQNWDSLTVEARKPLGVLLYAAHDFMGRLPWIQKCMGFWAGIVIPELVGVFLYKVVPRKPEIPEHHWIVVGPKWPYAELDENRVDQNALRNQTYSGLPNAYIWAGHTPASGDPDDAPNPACALDSYVGVIGEWVKAVRSGGDIANVFPVDVPSGKSAQEYANDIEPLLRRIDAEVLPSYAEDLKAGSGRRK
jgi:hypothetical protein